MVIALQNIWNNLLCVGYSPSCQPFLEFSYMSDFVAVPCNGPPWPKFIIDFIVKCIKSDFE